MMNPRVEDEGKIRAAGRVTAERGATSPILREEQRDKGQQQSLQKSGTTGGLLQYPKCVGITREGPTSQCEIQKIMGARLREEGSKVPRNTLKCRLGLHRGGEVGQSPSGLQGVVMGQSPRSHKGNATRSIETFCLAYQRAEYAGMCGEKVKGTVNPNFANLQKIDTSVVEEEGCQKKRPTQNLGHSKDNNSKWGARRKVRRMSREVRGSQLEEKESSLYDSDQDLNFSKVPRETLLSVDSNVGGEEGDSSEGEKTQNPIPLPDGVSGRFKTELGGRSKYVGFPIP